MKIKIKNTPDGVVCYDPQSYTTIRFNKAESLKLGVKGFPKDTPPEIVHLEISDRCNLNCPYCYVKDKSNKELATEEWKRIIKVLSDNGIFQVTFGGGEPTMRADLDVLAHYVKTLGLSLCMTSNGLKIPGFDYKTLQLFDQINISWHNQSIFELALNTLKNSKVRRGINYCLSKQYLKDLKTIKKIAKRQEAEILFLTYKPTDGDIDNQLPPKQVLEVATQAHKEGFQVAVDGMTCQTCLAAKRFCDIDSLGNLLLCSFIREPIGNLLKEPFRNIWARRNRKITCPYLRR